MKKVLFGLSILVALSTVACVPSGHEENFVRVTDQSIPGRISDAGNEQLIQQAANRETIADETATLLVKSVRIGGENFFKGKVTLLVEVHGKNLESIELTMLDSKEKPVSIVTNPCKSGKTVTVSTVYDRVKTKWFELVLINEANQIIARHRRPAN